MEIQPLEDACLVKAATGRFGTRYAIPVSDEIFGRLWACRGTYGVIGIVRAQTFEEAYECYLDDVAPDGDDNVPDDDQSHEYACWQEANDYRPNGGIADVDYNLRIDPLTVELAERAGLSLTWELEDDNLSTWIYKENA